MLGGLFLEGLSSVTSIWQGALQLAGVPQKIRHQGNA